MMAGWWPTGARGWSLRTLLGLSIMILLLLFGWTAWRERTRTLDDAERTAVRTVAALHEHAVKVLETHELVLDEVSRQIEGRSWDEVERDAGLWRHLSQVNDRLEQVRAINLVDGQGRIRMSTSRFPAPDIQLDDRDYFQAQKEHDAGTYVSAPYDGRIVPDRLIGLSRRRPTADGSFDGVIHIAVPVSYFTSFWEQFAPDIAHVIPLVRADGEVIARYPALHDLERLSTTGPFLARALRAPQGTYTAVSPVDGVERLTAYTRIKDYPLYIGFSIETRAILAQWYRDTGLYALFSALAVLALIGMTAMAIRQYRTEQAAARRWQEVADRLTAEMARREQAEQALHQSQKVEAVGQLTGGMAHDFNNLLQAMASSLFLLGRKVPADTRALVDASMQAVERGTKLVKQLMAFSRRQKLEPRAVDLRDLVAGMATLLQKAVGGTNAIEVEMDRQLDPVMVDPNQTELAILNLAINARDAMPGGGRITIAARNVTVLQVDRDAVKAAPGDYVVLSVTDTGTGIAPDVLERVFDPFFTTKEVRRGTGLGLSMVHGFVTQSGGAVEIESAPGRGTGVRLYLPKAEAGAEAPTAQRPEGAAASRAGETVLLVDDDALGRMGTAMALRELGYDVHEAGSGEEALAVLKRNSAVDLVITDYAMPGMTGAELARLLQDQHPRTKVMMITGYAASPLQEDAARVAALVHKPFRIEELAARVKAVLARAGSASNIVRLAQPPHGRPSAAG
jgi:signal transduction histidine kinase/ActR/RegA family two-component response regulator